MNKADLTEVLSARAGIPKVRAANYINIITDAIQEALIRDEKVTISDFGTFTVSQRRAFTGHNPKNGHVMNVPARKIPVFRSGKGLKGALNDGDSDFED
jgi:nucleoid DNA-binding protein